MTLVVNEEREELATVIRRLSVQNPIDGMKQLTSDCNEGLKSSLVACNSRRESPTVQRSDAAGDRSSTTSIDVGTVIAVPSFPKLAIPVPTTRFLITWLQACRHLESCPNDDLRPIKEFRNSLVQIHPSPAVPLSC